MVAKNKDPEFAMPPELTQAEADQAAPKESVRASSPPRPKSRATKPTGGAVPSLPASQAQSDLANAYRGMWATVAAMFDDASLNVTEAEIQAWTVPAVQTAERFGLDQHTEKLAPVSLVGVTIAQAQPRVKKILAKRTETRPRPNRPEPTFKRASGEPADNGASSGVRPEDIGIGYDKPEPLKPL